MTWGYRAEGSGQRVVVVDAGATCDCFLVDDGGGWHELDPGHGMRWGFSSRTAAVEAAERKLGERLVAEEGDPEDDACE